MTPAEELRAAAARLRELGGKATPGPWMVDEDAPEVVLKPDKPGFSWDGTVVATVPHDDFGLIDHANAEWIATMHPDLAEPLAAWLEAAYYDEVQFVAQGAFGYQGDHPALAVARVVNGGAP